MQIYNLRDLGFVSFEVACMWGLRVVGLWGIIALGSKGCRAVWL